MHLERVEINIYETREIYLAIMMNKGTHKTKSSFNWREKRKSQKKTNDQLWDCFGEVFGGITAIEWIAIITVTNEKWCWIH